MSRYRIDAARKSDHADLVELARHLDSVNLPNDAAAIDGILDTSERSFSGAIANPHRREYVFVLRDVEQDRAVGTSMIIGQLGRRDAPYIYFDVLTEEKYSATLDEHFVHTLLQIGYSYKGPTEIGGLVMHPDYRRSPARLGMLISYVRFLFIAMHRADMQDELLAELLPPLEPDGTSHLWEAVGRHFTGLTYREADRLSKKNKEFIRGLFPDASLYASLLSKDAQDVIGKVGPQTRGVEKILRRIGFRYAERVDPFDGGPHFVCPTDEVSLVRAAAQRTLVVDDESPLASHGFVAVGSPEPPYFSAIPASFTATRDTLTVRAPTAASLGAKAGDLVWCLPLDAV